MKSTTVSALIVVAFFIGIVALGGYVYLFNNFRPAKITSDEAQSIVTNYIDEHGGHVENFNISQPKQGYIGPNPFYYHTWDIFYSTRDGRLFQMIIDAHDGDILSVGELTK